MLEVVSEIPWVCEVVLDGVAMLQARQPEIPVIILTNVDDEDVAMRAANAGAYDYLLKREITPSLLYRTIRYARTHAAMSRSLKDSEERYALAVAGANDGIWDWRPETGNPPWNFSSIKKIPKVTHPCLVNVIKAGKYRFTLRQWPKEADEIIVGVKARIKIAGLEKETVIKDGSKEINFTLTLPSGITELWTYIYTQQGQVGGAYFTEVEKL